MKFLADMGIAYSTVTFLRDRGHDTVHLRDEGLQRLADEDIVKKAIAEKRAILTHDLDFGRLVAVSKAAIPSVITFRLQDMRPARVNRYLEDVLSRFTAELEAGALITVDERSIRIRPLPITK